MGGAHAPAGDPSDADAVARARDGDHQAFRLLVERYQGRVFALALRVLGDEEQARDAVQEGFLKAYRSLDRFEGRSSFYTWLYRLVMNLCIDMRRRDRSNRHSEWDEERSLETADPASVPGAGGGGSAEALVGPEADARRAELREAMTRAVGSLPDDARRTLLLREVDGLSYAEIARAMGIPKGTVMSRLHYARRRLRAVLTEMGAVEEGEGPCEKDAEAMA